MTSWLGKQKKVHLLELANTAGYKPDESKLKDDLIAELDEYLQKNETTLRGQSDFEEYYGRRRVSKPRESLPATSNLNSVVNDVEAEVKSVVKRSVKKAAKVKTEVENSTASFLASPAKVISDVASRISSPFTNAARTPASRRVSSMVPTTPGVVAEEIERATTKFYAGAGDLYSVSGIPDTLDWLRTSCSSVFGVQVSILLLEAYSLQKAVFPWNFAFDLPGIPAIGFPSIAVKVPDLFVLGRSSFWGPTILWTLTSIFIPLIFAYFYNLTVRPLKRHGVRVDALRYPYDPMTYSIIKAVLALVVYGAHAPYDYVDVYSARVVEHAMPGGYRGVITGCIISGIAAIWEAAQR